MTPWGRRASKFRVSGLRFKGSGLKVLSLWSLRCYGFRFSSLKVLQGFSVKAFKLLLGRTE